MCAYAVFFLKYGQLIRSRSTQQMFGQTFNTQAHLYRIILGVSQYIFASATVLISIRTCHIDSTICCDYTNFAHYSMCALT